MVLHRTAFLLQCSKNLRKHDKEPKVYYRSSTTTPSGAILPEPQRTRFGFLGVISGVVVGLLIGATLSKMMANFLEEKELFVPSDDDDDDD
ncbi:hypothetical protein KM043_002063 [Ampulex compressa]|nr:hypothetical protein KM043_002063 [Ampulex compressa]